MKCAMKILMFPYNVMENMKAETAAAIGMWMMIVILVVGSVAIALRG